MPLTYGVGNAAVGACSRAMQWMQPRGLGRAVAARILELEGCPDGSHVPY